MFIVHPSLYPSLYLGGGGADVFLVALHLFVFCEMDFSKVMSLELVKFYETN